MCDSNGCEIPKAASLACCEQGGCDASQNSYFSTWRSQPGSLGSREGLSVVQGDSELMGVCFASLGSWLPQHGLMNLMV